MNVIMYGIPNCDTIKKARKWLDEHQISYQFHDYRKQGLTLEQVNTFFSVLDWQQVVNKRGTTYRQLSSQQKDSLNEQTAAELLVTYPAMVKRPILLVDGQYYLGFKAEQYAEIFN